MDFRNMWIVIFQTLKKTVDIYADIEYCRMDECRSRRTWGVWLVRDGKWPKMESGSRGWKMKAVPGHGRTLKMELLPNILLTLVMLAIGECEQYSMKLKLNIQGSGIFYRISGVFKGFFKIGLIRKIFWVSWNYLMEKCNSQFLLSNWCQMHSHQPARLLPSLSQISALHPKFKHLPIPVQGW